MKPRRNPFHRPWIHRGSGVTMFIVVAFGGVSPLVEAAGDRLYQLATPSSSAGAAPPGSGAPPPVAPPGGPKGDVLIRTDQARLAAEAMQQAARELAANPPPPSAGETRPSVPDGLGEGGLQVDPRVGGNPALWTGADAPVQTPGASAGSVDVKVTQTAQQALLNWETFNVGKNTTLTFDQSLGGESVSQWIAFNFVNDPSANPTQILGSIQADGQVFVMNRNGVVFGAGSEVNARGLAVSSLPINTNLIERGLLNNPDAQFLFSGLDLPAGSNGTPAFTPEGPNPELGRYGDVVVEAGAKITSPTNAAKIGGRVTLVGANVTNEGTISTPDGQTILAAGLQVGFDAHSASDPSLRGLDVYVGSVGDYAGTATNNGLIETPRGSITIAGKEVNQSGILDSTTSVSLNGRIDLIAYYNATTNTDYDPAHATLNVPFVFRDSGTVTLGENSVIRILPELDSNETTIGNELALRSRVNFSGKDIVFGKGSILLAPNALVNAEAGEWVFTGSNPIPNFVRSTGSIVFGEDALIDVSGSRDVAVSVTQNIITVDLRGAELADSPLQRLGVLRNQTITVDIRDAGSFNGEMWVGTPLADIAGFANLIQRGVGELTVAGGTVNLSAGSSVTMQGGSHIDVSGGSIAWQGGTIQTTRLIAADGRIVDIKDARPDQLYLGIYEGQSIRYSPKWGVTGIYQNPLAPGAGRFEAGYTEGAAGGALAITAPSMTLGGTFLGETIAGERQRANPPAAASLTLSFFAQDRTHPGLPNISPSPPDIVFGEDGAPTENTLMLSPDLMVDSGFGKLTIHNNDGNILVPEGVVLDAGVKGSITLGASNITVNGSIVAAGGELVFNTYNLPLSTLNSLNQTPAPVEGRGIFTLGENGVITTAGRLVDGRFSTAAPASQPLILDGGSVSINAFTAHLREGGLIDVSGGAAIDARGNITYGDAGSLSIGVGWDLVETSVIGGWLEFGASLHGYSGAGAGSLSLTAPAIQVGGTSSNPNVMVLDPEFFNQGGFGNFTLTGIGLSAGTPGQYVPGVTIVSGTTLAPVVSSRLASVAADGSFGFNAPRLLAEGVRDPMNLTFRSTGARDRFSGNILVRGDIVMEEGSTIVTDGRGGVSFDGETVSLHGSIIAPGGEISITGARAFPSNVEPPLLPTVFIGGTASLSTAGKVILLPNASGLRQGEVLHGGSISISGNIVAQRGAVLDVSGTSGVLDLPPAALALDSTGGLSDRPHVPVTIETNGGSITLGGNQMLHTDATFVGHAGGASATGGMLTVSSGKYNTTSPGEAYTSADINLVVRQSGYTLAEPSASQGAGLPSLSETGELLPGLGIFAIDSYADGGFDSLTLGGNVRFEGDVTIDAPGSIRLASGGVIEATGNITLNAAHVHVGQNFRPPPQPGEVIDLFTRTVVGGATSRYQFAPVHGSGNLAFNANLIDIGTLSLQRIGNASFSAPTGDIRGNGTLQAAGHLSFTAGQIYPTTATAFNIFAYDSGTGGAGSVAFHSGTLRPLPLSGGGTLNVHASIIDQAGHLTAPIGTINLGWNGSGAAPANPVAGTTVSAPVTSQLTLAPGSVTSVSAIDPITGSPVLIPYGTSPDGETWIDPAGNDITTSGAPAKSVNLSAVDLESEEGSVVDISGGGDLYAFRWVEGTGGRDDVLATNGSFAVIPSYGFDYAPYAPFNATAEALGGDPGYVNGSLRVGDRITLGAGSGLPPGTYTLLPARYALLPGAWLITPKSGVPVPSSGQPDGSFIVSGYRANHLDPARTGAGIISRFEIAPSSVVRSRSEYQDFFANETLRLAALARDLAVPRLPMDAGHLSFSATTGFSLSGSVRSLAPKDGRGSLIDISSPIDILINATGTGGRAGELVLSAELLNQFGAESLLIGGLRRFTADGVTLTTTTGNLTLDNAGAALAGPDIILAARNELTLAEESEITATTGSHAFDHLLIGSEATGGSGDGTLVRVSGNTTGSILRRGVSTSTAPSLAIGSGVSLRGGSLVLDSTAATRLDDAAILRGEAISLSSGQISIQLENPGALNPSSGLVLSGLALDSLQSSARSLSLHSYSSLDVYGTGRVGSRAFESLTLQAASIRGFNLGGGTATFSAGDLRIENASDRPAGSPLTAPLDGRLVFDANEITLGSHEVRVDGFADVTLHADRRILVSGEGSFSASGNIDLDTRLVTGLQAADHAISADGRLRLNRPASSNGSLANGGLGASLLLQGADVEINGDISLASGELTLRAGSGDLVIGNQAASRIDLGGTSQSFIDVTRYTSGGIINLASDNGSVRVGDQATLSVSAQPGGGDAGAIHVTVPNGSIALQGTITGTAGSASQQGVFSLDASTIAGGRLASLDAILNTGGFTRSRDYRFRNGDVIIDSAATSGIYRVAADAGDILVTGTIDASGRTGGTIDLKAHGSLTLNSGSVLNAAAQTYDAAGKGGSVTLEAGAHRDGVIDRSASLDLRGGSTIDLSVAQSAAHGQFSGSLHLRAPRTEANDDVQISAVQSDIRGASKILVEGYRLYDLTGDGALTTDLLNTIRDDATAFLGAAGTTTAGYTAMLDRLRGGNSGLDLILAPGAEIINRSGNLTLGSSSSTAAADWDLSSFRFGPNGAAGVLTLRAAGNLTFFNALSDGFSGGPSLWLSPLMAHNELLPANAQSWSYRLTAGADFSAASFREVMPLESLAPETGLLELGKNTGSATGGANPLTSSIIANNFQVIRTGSGDIDISAGRSIRLLNPFASIYTAGTQVADPTRVVNAGDFVTPILDRNVSQGNLGPAQQIYPAQYSMAGGNVTLTAGENIERKTRNNSGLIDDSSRQLPNNWLYRRGLLGPDGNFGSVRIVSGLGGVNDPSASTSWWVDFSNFFQDVGALGGGNVSLTAGNDVKNVSAVIPTNARAAGGTPNANAFVELGGGNLSVRAGNDINGGVYYVERGAGRLDAGGAITTNSTRSPSRGLTANLNNPAAATLDPLTWLPTTLFAGKSSFEVTAAGDVLLGPVSNPFLLPQGLNNRFWYKTYFSTFAPDSGLTATSLGGDVTFRNAITVTGPGDNRPRPALHAWMETQHLYAATGSSSTSILQPWLRLAETSLAPFNTVWDLGAPRLSLTALSGNLNLTGSLTLFPSAIGQIELLASGGIQALQPSGRSNSLVAGQSVQSWVSSTLNLSDADPSAVPSALKPLTSFPFSAAVAVPLVNTVPNSLAVLAAMFGESGSYSDTNAVLQTRQARHSAGLLHWNDPEPVRIYALGGDLSGLTLFTPKKAVISAAGDITDIAFYLQNLRPTDVSIVTAGRDIVAYNASSAARIASLSSGNAPAFSESALPGDIQISGPGTLQVIAGRNLDLGLGSNRPDGTGAGITSIGNLRNPYLSPAGADLVVAAGLGPASSLALSALDLAAFISEFVLTEEGAKHLEEIAPGIDFSIQPLERQAKLAIEVFYRILRDTGRDFNDPDSEGYRNYDRGMAAIRSLFGEEEDSWNGEIFTRARDIRTRNGGNIGILVPGGGLTMANTTLGNPLTPPGIITEAGGNVSIFTDGNVDIGIGRIFTLRGGNAILWSTHGDIAAGSSSRTIQSAPPTRVVIDPQSAAVETDLAGLATGGGIGVLATVDGVEPGDVDLIAPSGTIDAGDAGIRVSGNINLAATQVVNAGNISAGGTTAGSPSASVSAPAVSTVTAASNSAAAAAATTSGHQESQEQGSETVEARSIITVEVIGYGGSGEEDEEEEENR